MKQNPNNQIFQIVLEMHQKWFLVYASRAINVLITVIFRVFFDDDNELTHFFRGGNYTLKSPKSANSSKLAKLQKTPKFMHENLAFFAILPIL